MDRFIECLCFENYNALIISGNPPKEILLANWLKILLEYHELKGEDMQKNEVWMMQRDIMRIEHHLYILQQCIDILWFEYRKGIADAVTDLGYTFFPESNLPHKYRPDLIVVVNESKTKLIELDQLNIKFKQLVPDADVKIQPEVFDEMLTAFEAVQKVAYSLESITVSKFVMLERKYQVMADAYEAKQMKNGY